MESVNIPIWINTIAALPPHSDSATRTLASVLNVPRWDTLVLVNYMVDLDWLLLECPALRTARNITLIVSANEIRGDDATIAMLHSRTYFPEAQSIEVITPPLPIPFGTHHSKCFLCGNARGVRVVIATANVLCDDWTRKCQGFYAQDFPRFEVREGEGRRGDPAASGGFGRSLANYFQLSGAPRIASWLRTEFDFSSSIAELVFSVPGNHPVTAQSEVGMLGLQRHLLQRRTRQQQQQQQGSFTERSPPTTASDAVSLLSKNKTKKQAVVLTWQYSSQGSLTQPFLSALTRCMTADVHSSSLSAAPGSQDKPPAAAEVRVLYPTEQQVRHSIEGWRGGSSLPVPIKNCHEFINTRLYRWGNGHPLRDRAMPHIKLYARHDPATQLLDWFCLTSMNLSRAAWGDLQKNQTTLMIRSYELGVLILPENCDNIARAKGFSCTPEAPLGVPSSATTMLTKHCFEGGRHAVLLPVNLWNPTPYASTVAYQQQSSLAAATRNVEGSRPIINVPCQDVPWVVDAPHVGRDSLGEDIRTSLMTYSHYGPSCWSARVVPLQDAAVVVAPPSSGGGALEGEGNRCREGRRDGTTTATKERASSAVEVIDVDEEEEEEEAIALTQPHRKRPRD